MTFVVGQRQPRCLHHDQGPGDRLRRWHCNLRFNQPVHLSICPSIHLSICPSVHLSICTSVHLFICPSVHLPVYPSVHMSICSSVHRSICSSVHLFIFPSVHLSIFPSFHTSILPYFYPPIFLFICLSPLCIIIYICIYTIYEYIHNFLDSLINEHLTYEYICMYRILPI